MNVYVYTNEGHTRVYKTLPRAVEQMLKDVGFDTLKQYVDDCTQWDVAVTWDNEQFSVDDGGPEIRKVDLL